MLAREQDLGATVLDKITGVGHLDGPILARQATTMTIERDTRYSDLSVNLCELGGSLVADILANDEISLEEYRKQSQKQNIINNIDGSTEAISIESATIKFPEMTANQVQTQFNALDGSPTRPRATFNFSIDLSMMDVPFLQKFDGQTVYFSGLY